MTGRCGDNMRIQFSLDKCAKVSFKKGLVVNSKNITLDINMEITKLEHMNTYKYSRIND